MAIHFKGDDDGMYKDELEQIGLVSKSRASKKADKQDPFKPKKTTSGNSSQAGVGRNSNSTSIASKSDKSSESQEKQKLYKRSLAGVKSKFKGKKKSKKKRALAGVAIAGLPTIAGFLILYGLLGFSVEHITKLQTAYRFGQFHRHMATVTRTIALNDAAISPGSKRPPNGAFTGGSLYERLRGWSGRKALSSLGATDLKLTYENGPVPGTRRIVSIENTRTGESTTRTAAIDPKFDADLRNIIDSSLTEQGRSKFFRRNTVNHVRSTGGLKLSRFKGFLENRNKAPPSADATRVIGFTDDIGYLEEGHKPIGSSIAGVEEDAKNNLAQSKETGRPVRGISASRLGSINASQVAAGLSDVVFIMTLYCIFRDLSDQTQDVIENRVNGYMKLGQSLHTASDQFKTGDATQAALRYESTKWETFEKSQAYAMSTNRSLNTVAEEDMLQSVDLPLKVFGFNINTLNDLAAVVSNPFEDLTFLGDAFGSTLGAAFDSTLDGVCTAALNPYVQGATAVAEVGFSIYTGGLKTFASEFVQGLPKLIGLSVGVSFVVSLSSAITDHINAVEFTVGEGEGAAGLNKADAGWLMAKNASAAPYAAKISPELAAQQGRQGVLDLQKEERSKGALYAYFSPNNPFSLTSSFAVHAPYSFTGVVNMLSASFSSIFNVGDSLGLVFGTTYADEVYDPELEFYGMQDKQYGFTDSQVDGSDPLFAFDNVVNRVEPEIERFKAEYGECLTVTALEIALDLESPKCNGEEGQVYGMYFAYCSTIAAVSLEGTANDPYVTEDCLDLAGSSRGKFKLSSGTSSPGGPGGGIADLNGGTGLNITGPTYDCQGNGLAAVPNSAEGNDWSNIVPTGDIGPNSDGDLINVYIREACQATGQKTVVLVGSIHGSENAGQRVAHEMLFSATAGVPDNVRVIAIPELCNCASTGRRANNNIVGGLPTDLNRNFDYNWGDVPDTGTVSGNSYSKGSAPFSATEAAAFKGFADQLGGEIDLLAVFHSGLLYVASAGTTPVSIARTYADASSGAVPLRSDESGSVYQGGSLDGWINDVHGVDALLVEMGSGSTDTANIPGHVQGVISAIKTL